MSKSKGNGIDPWEIINEFGTDAFRWALLSDSAPWSSKKFSKQIVAEAKSKAIDTINNTHAFYALYAQIDQYKPEDHPQITSVNVLDRWILFRLNSTLQQVVKGLEINDFLNPAKQIETFVDELSNWYIRRSRDRFWGSEWTEDKISAYQTLRHVLLTLAQLIAPYTPLIADDLYANLGGKGSVHLTDYPKMDESLYDVSLENEMETVRQIVELARNIRNETGIKTRMPLSELYVSFDGARNIGGFEDIIQDEINVKSIHIVSSDVGFVRFTFKLNLKAAGKKFGKFVGPMQAQLKQLSALEAKAVIDIGFLDMMIDDEVLHILLEDLLIEKQANEGYASVSGYQMTVALNTTMTEELEQEGVVREVIRAIQDYRKKIGLPIEKRIDLVLGVDAELQTALVRFDHVLHEHVLLNSVRYATEPNMETVSYGESKFSLLIV
jgi:isoleucyl-tRNA synthetase